MPNPATTTPNPSAIVANQPPAPGGGEDGGGVERRRGGVVDIEARLPRAWQEASRVGANSTAHMIRVSVPIDLNAVASSASIAFALATPLRVQDVVRSGIIASLGRAPQDKRDRVLRRTLDGLRSREFLVEIDGRIYDDADDVVVCSGVATLRFFTRRSYPRAA